MREVAEEAVELDDWLEAKEEPDEEEGEAAFWAQPARRAAAHARAGQYEAFS